MPPTTHGPVAVIWAALVLLSLSACDMVQTRHPVPARLPSTGGLVVADGVWLQADRYCPVNSAAPRRLWPSCAVAFEVRHGVARALAEADGVKPSRTPPGVTGRLEDADYPFVFVAGQPDLLRVRLTKAKRYVYFGLRIDQRNHRGQVVGYSAWPVLCGPQQADPPGRPRTFAGLKRLGGSGEGCATSSLRALRQAARLSQSPDRTATFVRVDDPATAIPSQTP